MAGGHHAGPALNALQQVAAMHHAADQFIDPVQAEREPPTDKILPGALIGWELISVHLVELLAQSGEAKSGNMGSAGTLGTNDARDPFVDHLFVGGRQRLGWQLAAFPGACERAVAVLSLVAKTIFFACPDKNLSALGGLFYACGHELLDLVGPVDLVVVIHCDSRLLIAHGAEAPGRARYWWLRLRLRSGLHLSKSLPQHNGKAQGRLRQPSSSKLLARAISPWFPFSSPRAEAPAATDRSRAGCPRA